MTDYAPIVLFVYNRLQHTEAVINALLKNEEAKYSELYIFSDAPRHEEQREKVSALRTYIKTIIGFKSVQIFEREKNLGLAKSIVTGLDYIFQIYEKAIILEDDIVVRDDFLKYMNGALFRYRNERKVYSVCGYSMVEQKDHVPDFYFLKFTSCWGWATWADRWNIYDEYAEGWEEILKNKSLRRRFNYDNSYDWSWLLREQMEKGCESWAIRWYWSVFKAGGYNLYPRQSRVRNIGFDGSGTHGTATVNDINDFESIQEDEYLFPTIIEENEEVVYAVRKNLRKMNPRSLINRIKGKICVNR